MSRLEIALLGPPEVNIEGSPVQTDRRKAIALLAYLAVTGKSHPRESLAALLWPDYDRNSAFSYLRRTLWELNQMLGKGWIDADREHVALVQASGLWLDTAVFQSLTQSKSGEAAALIEAINLYRGEFLAGFTVADTAPFEDWQYLQAEYFRRELARALDSLVEIHLQTGEHEPALPHARRWLALDPINETAHRAIMRLLAGMGDRTGAIRQYENCTQILEDELGISPQAETTELYEAILRGELSGTRNKPEITQQSESTPIKLERPVSRLPVLPTPFIGRRLEVEQVKSLIHSPSHHLITMIGPGGTGKTRLSIQAASEVGDAFPDGVFFAPLASVQTADAVLPAVAKAVDFSFYQEEESRQKQLLDFLREKQILLVLDNFEHVLEAASLVNDILTTAPDVKLIVTSRIRLNVQGEQIYTVAGMRTPAIKDASHWDDPETQAKPFSSVQLFLDAARRSRAKFSLTKTNLVPVLEICEMVQGMPLALELAAAWSEVLTPQEISDEIRRSLDFLETDQTGVPDRQRSIRAVFESSWRLLSDVEQDVFLRLCVFVGSFSREAAQHISGASLRTLLGLANKSWLQQAEEGRFQLHELMRQYGEERFRTNAAAWREAKNRHADYFADFVARQAIKLTGFDQPAGLDAMELEFGSNLKAAWDWLVAEHRWHDMIDRMALGLFQFSGNRWREDEIVLWFRRARLSFTSVATHKEPLAFALLSTLEILFEEASGIKAADTTERLNALCQIVIKDALYEPMGFWFMILAGIVKFRNMDLDFSEQFERSIVRLREQNLRWELAYSLSIQANWWVQHGYDEDRLQEALKIFQEIGARYEQAIVYQRLGRHAFQQSRNPAEVTGYFHQARKVLEQLGENPFATNTDWHDLADMYIQQGEYEQGFALLHELQRFSEQKGNIAILINYFNWEGLAAVRYSKLDHAMQVRLRAVELARKLGNPRDLSWQLLELGDVYRISNDFIKARECYDQAEQIFENIDEVLGIGYRQRGLGDIALHESRYPEARNHYQEFLQYAAQADHLWSIVQAHGKLALAHAHLGNLAESRHELQKALLDLRSWPEDQLYVLALLAEPVCLLQENKPEQAIELAALIANHRAAWHETRRQAQGILDRAAQELPVEIVQAAIERGKGLDLETVVEWLLAE